MKIVIDGRMYRESGIGRYIRNLIENLQRLDKVNQYFILLNHDNYDRLMYYNNFQKVLADFKWYGVGEQIKLPQLLKKLQVEFVHFPHFNVPIFYQGKFIVTVHDLIHQHFRMDRATTLNPLTYKLKQLGYKKVFQNAITKSLKILVPSNYVKNLLIKEWGILDEKITVTYEAADDIIFSTANIMGKGEIDRIMEKFSIKQPYIFYVGNAHPHKNVEGLIKVFLELRKKYPKLSLVLSGNDHYFWQRIKNENQYEGIIYTGYVNDEELVALYKNAKLFIMPSFEEGFGIPLLEAMAAGCPVVSSNAGALKEVGGDAAIYFDPHDVSDMVNKIERIMTDNNLRYELIKKGQKRVKLFSWERLVKQTLEVYESCYST